MSRNTVIALAIVNAVLLAVILIWDRGQLSTTETAGRSNQVLRTFVRDRVDRVELVRGDDDAIVFVRERDEEEDDEDILALGTWVIAEPVATAADDDAVDGLLSALEWLAQRRTLENVTSEDRERFGLDEPRFVVRYTVIEDTYELRVGGEAPTGDGVYVAVEGEDDAYVVGADFIESIDHDLAHFRNKELFEGFFPTGAERVEVDSIVFEREDGIWQLRRPGRGWANQGLVDRLLRVTRELRAARFVAEGASDLAEYGLDAPWHELTVTRGEDITEHRTAHLRVGDPCGEHDGERYAIDGDEGPVVCVAVSDLEALEIDRGRLREPRLLAVRDDDVQSVVLATGGERLELSREEDNWKIFTGPEDARGEPVLADEAAVTAWLGELRESSASAFEPFEEGRARHGRSADPPDGAARRRGRPARRARVRRRRRRGRLGPARQRGGAGPLRCVALGDARRRSDAIPRAYDLRGRGGRREPRLRDARRRGGDRGARAGRRLEPRDAGRRRGGPDRGPRDRAPARGAPRRALRRRRARPRARPERAARGGERAVHAGTRARSGRRRCGSAPRRRRGASRSSRARPRSSCSAPIGSSRCRARSSASIS